MNKLEDCTNNSLSDGIEALKGEIDFISKIRPKDKDCREYNDGYLSGMRYSISILEQVKIGLWE